MPINDPQTRIRGYEELKVISHHVHLRPTLDGSRVVDVTMDMTPDQLTAGSHAVRTVVADRYRVATLESADDILAMRELTSLADELQSLVVPGAIARLTLNVGGIGRFSEALEAFVRARVRRRAAGARGRRGGRAARVRDHRRRRRRPPRRHARRARRLARPPRVSARPTGLAAVLVAAVALCGCTTEIDAAKGEKLIERAVTSQVGAKVRSVECPEGLVAKKGARFRCKVTGADGSTGDVVVTERDAKGKVSIDAPFLHVRAVEDQVSADLRDKLGDAVEVACPEIVVVAKGDRFTCSGRSAETSRRIRVVQQDARGHVRYTVTGLS